MRSSAGRIYPTEAEPMRGYLKMSIASVDQTEARKTTSSHFKSVEDRSPRIPHHDINREWFKHFSDSFA